MITNVVRGSGLHAFDVCPEGFLLRVIYIHARVYNIWISWSRVYRYLGSRVPASHLEQRFVYRYGAREDRTYRTLPNGT